MKMNKWVIFLFLFLAGFGMMELFHFVLPLPVRIVTSPLIILSAVSVWFFIVKPLKPWIEALRLAVILAVAFTVLVAVMHGLVYRDLGQSETPGRLAFVASFLLASPFFGALAWTLFGKKR
jgi:predicted neutral ceramidase superfamily lipid hydrolase